MQKVLELNPNGVTLRPVGLKTDVGHKVWKFGSSKKLTTFALANRSYHQCRIAQLVEAKD